MVTRIEIHLNRGQTLPAKTMYAHARFKETVEAEVAALERMYQTKAKTTLHGGLRRYTIDATAFFSERGVNACRRQAVGCKQCDAKDDLWAKDLKRVPPCTATASMRVARHANKKHERDCNASGTY
jgi:hypothetical protein